MFRTAMMTHLDTSVGAIVKSLEETNMLKDSIIVFSTDNGGACSIVQSFWGSMGGSYWVNLNPSKNIFILIVIS